MRGLRAAPEINSLKLAYFVICLIYNFTEAAFKMMSPVWMLFIWAAIAYRLGAQPSDRPAIVNESGTENGWWRPEGSVLNQPDDRRQFVI
jgi:hypothetical protein